MTTQGFVRIAARRWYVLVVGVALTVTAVTLVVVRAPTVYWARTTITLLQPDPNPLRADGGVLTGLASALVVRANGAPAMTKTSSPDTTLYGEGIMDGTRIRIRDVGAQWSTSIPDPIIVVEAVGPDAEDVASEITEMVQGLNTDLTTLQSQLGVAKQNSVFMRYSPDRPNVILVRGNRTRSAGATLLLGMALTAVAVYLVDRALVARRRQISGSSSADRTPESSTV